MGLIRDYVLGIAAAAMICAVTLCFAEEGHTKPLMKLICGLILTFSIVRPVLNICQGNWEELGIDYRKEAEEAAEQGTLQAEKTVRELIKEQLEAYILDKAQAMDLQIQVDVTLSQETMPVPEAAEIRGSVPPYQKTRLLRILTEELGIRKENIRWIS